MAAESRVESTYCFCPYDGSELSLPTGKALTRTRKCPECEFVDYQNPKPCVAIFIEQGGRLLLGRRAGPPGKGLWDIPGGFVEPGESFEEAVVREIREETGLRVADLRFIGSLPDVYGHRRTPTINTCFRAMRYEGEPKPADDLAELRWFAASELPNELAFAHQAEAIKLWLRDLGQTPTD